MNNKEGHGHRLQGHRPDGNPARPSAGRAIWGTHSTAMSLTSLNRNVGIVTASVQKVVQFLFQGVIVRIK